MKWDKRFLNMARLVADWSKDPSTKVGCILTDGKFLVSVGFNGFPAGCDDDDCYLTDRQAKYARTLHAELNAILSAARSLKGCTAYVWPMPPCSQCMAAFIQKGISRIVTVEPDFEAVNRWGESFSCAKEMACEAGVELVYLEEL